MLFSNKGHDYINSILIIIFTFALDRAIFRMYFDFKTEKAKRTHENIMNILNKKGRVFRGLTPAGHKSRGLTTKSPTKRKHSIPR